MSSVKGFKAIDKWIVVIASLSLVTSSALLLDDNFFFRLRKNNQAPTDPIAHIIGPEKDVRRRLDGDVIWFPVQQKDSVFQDDSIFTGDASRTDVVFEDKTSLAVSAQSLIRISIRKGKTTLQLIHGKVRVKVGTKGNITLVANGKSKVISGNGVAEINVPPRKEAEITSVTGKMEVLSENQKQPVQLVAQNQEPPKQESAPQPSPQAATPQAPLIATEPDERRRPGRSIATDKVVTKEAKAETKKEPENIEDLKLSGYKTQPPTDPTFNFSSFSFGHTFTFSKISGSTIDRSRSAQIISLLNFGAEARWDQTWSRYWKSAFSFEYLYQEFEKINGITFNNTSKSFVKFGLEGGREINKYWTLMAGAKYGQQAYISKITSNEITMDRTTVPTLMLKSDFNFTPLNQQSIGLNLGATMQLPSQGDGYTTSTNLGYFSDLVVRGHWTPHTFIEGKFGYLYQNQNTSSISQSFNEVRFNILFSFSPGGI